MAEGPGESKARRRTEAHVKAERKYDKTKRKGVLVGVRFLPHEQPLLDKLDRLRGDASRQSQIKQLIGDADE